MNIEKILLEHSATPSRREFLRTSGRLVVGVSAATVVGPFVAGAGAQDAARGLYPDPDYHQLDSWIVIHEDNTATFYVGKTDCGQGTGTAFRQLMSDELDIAYDKTTCIMGTTDITVDQGGSGGSDAIQTDGWPMRRVAAEARRVLLEMASQRMGVPVAGLAVSNAVISVKADPAKKVTYGELIGGKKFNVALTGANIDATTGVAKVKPVQELKMVGQSPQRYDIPAKVDGSNKWAVDVKLPGMVHARNVKPPVAGAKLVGIDESSVRNLPGFVKVVSKGNYVAVVFEREEQAIAGARQLKANWQKPATPQLPDGSDGLFKYMRGATPTSSQTPINIGTVDSAFSGAAKVVEAEYEIPYQGHNSIGPAHALADPSNGQMTIYSNDMKSYGMRNGVAQFLGMPREQVRVIWMDGPQGYGRTAADDAGFEAAYLAKELGRPVRMQWMRDEEQAWDTKGPAFTVKIRGALDAEGRMTALDYAARSADYNHLGYNEPDTVLIAQLFGQRRDRPAAGSSAFPNDMYAIPNRRTLLEVVGLPLLWETPLRTGNLRDPNGPQSTFAAESFIDEMAFAAKADPVEFRMRMLTASTADDNGFKRARSIAVLKATAEKYGWQPRPGPNPNRGRGDVLTGRGVAYTYRNQTVIAQIAEVEVNRRTGRVWVKRVVVGHDCGLVVNPEALHRTIDGATQHGISRALYEEVAFDTEKVLSRDWMTHPTLTHLDAPQQIDVVLVNGDPNPNRPDLPHYGAGEAAMKPTIAAVANAIFDATGVRMRRVPFRKERVLAALNAANA
ncbi:MAG TPA: molybdopterin cofactor-binding domain-containing protein [Vicinamibacterales bacterium]|jgi:CO/xanthine dehydrogenase Mo-binding subunit|nr:molybdopterin cofactor-binding domain-containing protein [Vicinamibacterales bacterium]